MGEGLKELLALTELLNAHPEGMELKDLSQRLSLTREALMLMPELASSLDLPLIAEGEQLRLLSPVDLLHENVIFDAVTGRGRVSVVPETGSTNTALLENLNNTVSGDALLCELQSAGRGRRGHGWKNSLGRDLALSVVCDLDESHSPAGLSLVVGLAAIEALNSLGVTGIALKWPNDLYFGEGKLAGILVETGHRHGTLCAVCGIGLNVHSRHVLLGRTVACVDDCLKGLTRDALSIALIDAVRGDVALFNRLGFLPFKERFDAVDRLCGRTVTLELEDEEVTGVARGISGNGELILNTGKERRSFATGHVVL